MFPGGRAFVVGILAEAYVVRLRELRYEFIQEGREMIHERSARRATWRQILPLHLGHETSKNLVSTVAQND
jgi:hypothetical protein